MSDDDEDLYKRVLCRTNQFADRNNEFLQYLLVGLIILHGEYISYLVEHIGEKFGIEPNAVHEQGGDA